MPSTNKDRVTISLHLDKRTHALLKRCSAIEKQPMSRFVDKQLGLYLEKYAYDTFEESEIAEPYRLEEIARAEELEMMTYEHTRDDELSSLANNLSSLEDLTGAPVEAIQELRNYLLGGLNESEHTRITQLQKEKQAESDRWKEIAKKYPLP